MKKLIFLIAFVSLVFMQSCEKSQFEKKETVSQTVNATLKTNGSYSFTLPTDIDDDAFYILADATNASVSRLTETTYEYTPTAGFVGTDVIVLSNEHEKKGKGGLCGNDSLSHDSLGHPHDSVGHPRHPRHPRLGLLPRKKRPEHNHYNITINLTVEAGDSTTVGKFVK